jgi:type III secretion system FlhB-like substrate exporter
MSMSNKYYQAFALDLPGGDENPPVLAARGEYKVADFIVACARKHGIPIVERDSLCSALEAVDLDTEIPVELFEAAAAVLREIGAIRGA